MTGELVQPVWLVERAKRKKCLGALERPDHARLLEMQFYKHYYEREMMNPGDNPPIGIVLGYDRDEAVIRYTLNEHERNLLR